MQQDYQIFPKRNGKSDGSFKKIQPLKFFTNFYEINIQHKKDRIHQYSIQLDKDVPQDSEFYPLSVKAIKRNLKEKIGFLAYKGQIIWSTKQSKIPLTIECKFNHNGEEYSFEALIKHTKEISLKDLDKEETRPALLQILNINLKDCLKQANMYELGKSGKYFEIDQHLQEHDDIQKIGLQVFRGFKLTLTPLNRGICLQVDVCSRVLQSINLLQMFNGSPKDKVKEQFQGKTIITKYGIYRTYCIEQVDYGLSPLSEFYNQRKGCKMTYQQYFKDAYGLKVSNKRQPLIKVLGRQRKEIKNNKIVVTPEYIYLIPEFVSQTGMTDNQKANHSTMKAISPYTKLTPNQREKESAKMVNLLNDNSNLFEIKNAIRMDGYCLDRPNLEYTGQTIQADNKGAVRHRGVLKEPFNFTDWMFVYSQGKQSGRDDDDADKAVDLLRNAGKTYGIKFKDAAFLTVGNSVKSWKQAIEEDVKNNGRPQIIVLYLNQYEEKFYGELKKFITNELQCPTQFIRKKTLNSPKGAMSAASKICIQMNIKVGATPWEVKKKHPYFKNKNVMYGAISLSKGSKGFTIAFVGTINNECTKVYSDCQIGIKSKENIPVDTLQNIFVEWAKAFYKTNGRKVPELIILYRQGLSDVQAKDQLARTQIRALENMVKTIGDKTKTKGYNPQIQIVLVNKKINTRYFMTGRENPQNVNKFTPQLYNPDSGSVLIESASKNDEYDFYLAAQLVTQGTCTPTYFKVAYDTTKMPQEALISFTFEQCFNYYNWEGAVRVPACLQCADKLSKLVGESVKQSIVQGPVTQKHFFL